MKHIQAPNLNDTNLFSIFLAGAIDMGKAEEWQKRVVDELKNYNVVILNPRRDDWDSSWKQSKEDKRFSEQVNWELDNLEVCDLILLHMGAEAKAPISLLELGLHAKSKKLIVSCHDKFWRRGNVEIVCDRAGIKLHNTLDKAIAEVKKKIFAYEV